MSKLIDIVVIVGDWKGGNHNEYPIKFTVDPDSKHPFCVSEGHGWGGGCFNLNKLFEGNYLKIFNRSESEIFYQKRLKAYELNQDQESLAKELIKEFSFDDN